MLKWLKKKHKWIRTNLLTKEMFIFTIIGELIFWSPVWVCGILAICIDHKFWAAAAAVIAFWSGPFTPAVPLQLGLILLLKKLFSRRNKK